METLFSKEILKNPLTRYQKYGIINTVERARDAEDKSYG